MSADTILALIEQLADRMRQSLDLRKRGDVSRPIFSLPIKLWPLICPVVIKIAEAVDLKIDPLEDYRHPPGMMHLRFQPRRARSSNAAAVRSIASTSSLGSESA